MGILSMNSTLEVVEFAGKAGRDGSSIGQENKTGRDRKSGRRRVRADSLC